MSKQLNWKRWENFKKNRRAFYSAIIFGMLFFLSLFADFIANDKPLYIKSQDKVYFPIFNFYSEVEFGGDLKTEAIYADREIQCLILTEGNDDCWDSPETVISEGYKNKTNKGVIIWPLIRFNHNTIADLNVPAPSPPDSEHWLGTDDTARDVLARIIYGFRISVIFGLTVTFFASMVGVFAGAMQGYFGGKTDLLAQRFIEIWNSVPSLYVIIILSAFLISNKLLLTLTSENLFKWYQQLIAESLGKNKKGILPIISNMPKDNHSVMQLYLDGFKNNFYTFFYTDCDEICVEVNFTLHRQNYSISDGDFASASDQIFKAIRNTVNGQGSSDLSQILSNYKS